MTVKERIISTLRATGREKTILVMIMLLFALHHS